MRGPEPRPQAPLAGYRLLVVEDDYFVAQDLCKMLREHGATILGPAPNVASARRLASTLHPDCILLDINLDGEHAFDLATQLQARDLRVIFTTGYDESFVPTSLQDTACFQKPIDAAALVRSILERVSTGSPPQ